MNFKIKVGDYVKVLRNGEFHNIINKTCIISGVVTWEDFHG